MRPVPRKLTSFQDRAAKDSGTKSGIRLTPASPEPTSAKTHGRTMMPDQVDAVGLTDQSHWRISVGGAAL